MDQMTIFDFLPQEYAIEKMTIKEIAEVVGERLGIRFQKSKLNGLEYEPYEAKVGKVTLEIEKSQFLVPPYTWYVGCGVSYNKGGAGAPIETMDGAVKWFKRVLSRNELYTRRA